MSHTPGPWTATKEWGNQDLRPNVAVLHSYRIVCDAEPGTLAEDADARLIAAAPDLLCALRELLKVLHDGDPAWQEQDSHCILARAVIAKAEGKEAP